MSMNKKKTMQDKMNRQYFLLIVPGMLIFTIGVILPLLLAFRYSVTSWDGMTVEKDFVGISNYINLWKDANFRQAWWFTIKFTIANTIVQNVFALLFAVALDSGIKAQKVYRTILFIPCLVSAVIVGFVWLKLYSNVLPELNEIFGTNINFLLFGDGKTVLSGLAESFHPFTTRSIPKYSIVWSHTANGNFPAYRKPRTYSRRKRPKRRNDTTDYSPIHYYPHK